MADGDDGPTTRVEVIGGGRVGAQELAALVVALTPDPPPGDDEIGGPARDEVPAWARAALLEGVGMLPPSRPSDLKRTWLVG